MQRYLAEHRTLDAALAEAAALAADDVLLDQLRDQLGTVPGALRFLLGVSVYRRPVDANALRFQAGVPDPTAATTVAWQDAQRHIRDLLVSAGVPPGPVDLGNLPVELQASLTPHLRIRLDPPVRRRRRHLAHVGRHEEALGAAAEAVTIRRKLAAVHPAVFAPSLVTSLHNLHLLLVALGREDEADGAARELAELRSRQGGQ